MKWSISEEAEVDLAGIWEYSYEIWGRSQAERYLLAIYQRFDWLLLNPALWRNRDDIRPGLFSAHAEQHEIFFRFENEHLTVRRILHQKRNFSTHLADSQ